MSPSNPSPDDASLWAEWVHRHGRVNHCLSRSCARPEKGPLASAVHDEPLRALGGARRRSAPGSTTSRAYRVGVHDEFLNAVPCGYDKESPDRKRPRFHRGPLQMIGWLVGLVYNAVADLTDQLPDRFQNLRSTRQTELSQQFPEHVVCAMAGQLPRRGGQALFAGD